MSTHSNDNYCIAHKRTAADKYTRTLHLLTERIGVYQAIVTSQETVTIDNNRVVLSQTNMVDERVQTVIRKYDSCTNNPMPELILKYIVSTLLIVTVIT